MRYVPAVLVLSVCLAGCGQQQSESDADAGDAAADSDRSLLNPKLTSDIGRFDPTAGRKVSDSRGTYSNPLTGALEMYGPMLERLSKMKIEHAVRLFQAEHGRYPKDYDEFMTRIIQANHIRLPELPGELEYQYDVQNHKLVVVEKAAEK